MAQIDQLWVARGHTIESLLVGFEIDGLYGHVGLAVGGLNLLKQRGFSEGIAYGCFLP
jgi:hypothetical protein